MTRIRYLILDVLKAHQPDVVEFASRLSMLGPDYEVGIRVLEMDDKTETVEVLIEAADIDFARVKETIETLGGSLHSIDHVIVAAASGSVSAGRPSAD